MDATVSTRSEAEALVHEKVGALAYKVRHDLHSGKFGFTIGEWRPESLTDPVLETANTLRLVALVTPDALVEETLREGYDWKAALPRF